MIVETGDGLVDSNSYISVIDANTYFSARGIESWDSLTDEEKEQALIKATDYIDSAFKWRGKKKTSEQALNFPRVDLIDDNGFKIERVPNALRYAVCESANLVATGTELFQTQESNGAVTSEKIGQLSFTYDTSKKLKDSSLFDSINLRLRGLVIDTNGGTVKTGKVTK